jgi:hypothetical protein
MMAARQKSRRVAGKPPEDRDTSKILRALEGVKEKRQMQKDGPVKVGPPVGVEKQKEQQVVRELPYVDVPPLPFVKRVPSVANIDERDLEEELVVREPGFKNRAPLQSDEKAKDLIRNALKNPISVTTEDLLNVSEPMRQELRKLLTKKRLENKSVAFASEVEMHDDVDSERNQESEIEEVNTINIDKLPSATYEVTMEDIDGVPKGSLVISDPVVQYLSTLQPGEKPKSIIVARESQSLRAVYPLINNVGEVESLLDGGSQIVSMSRGVAVELEVTWDPDITVQMQSANRTLEQTLGLAKNVPFLFGHITVYLQVHVMDKPAYKVLLGRPFDTITESEVKNAKDGGQSLTLTDPNTGERCVMHTHERGKPPTVLKRPVKRDFQNPSMN